MKILCGVMEVSASGYYAWLKRRNTPFKQRRISLTQTIRHYYFDNMRRYGSRRIQAAMAKEGIKAGRFQIRQIMKEEQLEAIRPKMFKPQTTDSKGTIASPNLLKGVKIAECAPTKVIIGDITCLPMQNGSWTYLAMWQDKVTRRIVGWKVASEMTAELVINALEKAIGQDLVLGGAVIHTDRGSQYGSKQFRKLLQMNNFRQSMSGKGNCYDNAQAESFFSRFKTELIEGGAFETLQEAESEIFNYIEAYYNPVRLHSSLGYKSPLEFEAEWKMEKR